MTSDDGVGPFGWTDVHLPLLNQALKQNPDWCSMITQIARQALHCAKCTYNDIVDTMVRLLMMIKHAAVADSSP